MELRLEQLIADAGRIANVQNMDANNPIIVRVSNPSISSITAIVCSHEEPSNLILPLNVTWFDFNPLSLNYNKALRRVSKTPDAVAGTSNTWESITTYDEVFVVQAYDTADTATLSTVSTGISPATTVALGIARLSSTPTNPADPVVVITEDPRLSDSRDPTPHTHPQVPATELQTLGSVVTISDATTPQAGFALVAISGTQATWRALTTFDITP